MKRTLYIALILIISASCKKEKVEIPESNDPVFVLHGNLGTESIDLVAGDNGTFMHTASEWVNGVQLFSGTMEGSEVSVKLGIYDGWIDLTSYNPLTELGTIPIPFAVEPSEPLVLLDKYAFQNQQNIEEIEWYANGVMIGVDSAHISQPGRYEVCAHVQYMGGGQIVLCNDVIVGYRRNANASIQFDYNTSTNQLHANLDPLNGQVSQVRWFFNGLEIGAVQPLNYQTTGNAGELRAEIEFMNGVKRTKKCWISNNGISNSLQDFTLFEETPTNSVEQDFNLEISLEKDGKIYESATADNSGASVSINEINYYGKNDNGKDVYKLDVTVSCMLRAQGSFKQIPFNFNAIFGIEAQ